MGRSTVGGESRRMIRGRGTGRAWAGRRWEGEESVLMHIVFCNVS